jgi:hypothetical protein
MQSPFPGMDPYLEQFWPDVHARMVLYTCDQLEDQLPSSLIARVEERIVLESEIVGKQVRHPDVKITERKGRENGGRVAVLAEPEAAEPVIVECEPVTETYINIVEAGSKQRLVTVIEILSMANKGGQGFDDYRAKQAELRDAGVNLVEIDLLRRGMHVMAVDPDLIPRQARTTYLACVQRGGRPGRFELYPIPLRGRLPRIRIPLRKTDVDIRLDLQAVLEQAYRKGRYHLTIDYGKRPNPPLRAADTKWAKALIAKHVKKHRA